MSLDSDITSFIREDVVKRVIRYAKIHTTSDPNSNSKPSSNIQHDLLKLLAAELNELGLHDVRHDQNGFVYATLLPANDTKAPLSKSFGLMAHVDTSPDQDGCDVKPILRANYDGAELSFPDDSQLTLSPKDSPELLHFLGDTIITASGKTLLGADDKAGVAEIMTAVAALRRFPKLTHGRTEICFTSDEEVGRGVEGIDLSRLPPYLYTMDGGYPGTLETECFDAIGVKVEFQGIGVHPGYAYGKMVNAILAAASFTELLPKAERPETTKDRAGFFHLTSIEGTNEFATARLILRDYDHQKNAKRLDLVQEMANEVERGYPGLKIAVTHTKQYENMGEVLARNPEVAERAKRAIEASGLKVKEKAIRGGTDGSRLCAMGYPTPNIFAGGMLFHSRREWIAVSALTKAVETILNLADLP
jgi:tripeptide aminopeptidase